jgi:hypothetical protein
MKHKTVLLVLGSLSLLAFSFFFLFSPRDNDPTPTPNLAPMPYGWEQWGGNPPNNRVPQYLFIDTAVTHDGHASLRMEADYDITGSERDAFPKPPNYWIPIKPGDHIVFTCWMKLNAGDGSDSKPYDGARLGIDFYDNVGWLAGTSSPDGDPTNPAAKVIANWVNWGTTQWAFRKIEFFVLQTYGGKVPTGMIPWIQVLPQGNTGYAWFADCELYVNP